MSSTHSMNQISDVANPAPIHRAGYVDVIVQQMSGALDREYVELPRTLTDAETAVGRTRRFREMRLVEHRGGVMACAFCHIAPYYCHCCSGLKCQCKVDGIYRHWKNGVPYPSAKEALLLEDVDL